MIRAYTCNIGLPFYVADDKVGVTLSVVCPISVVPVYLNGEKVGDATASRQTTLGYLYESFYLFVVIQTERDDIFAKLQSTDLTVEPVSEVENGKEILKAIKLV